MIVLKCCFVFFSFPESIESTIISIRSCKKVVLVWSWQEYGDNRSAQWQLRSNSLLAEWMCCWRHPKRNYLWIPKVWDDILHYNGHMIDFTTHALYHVKVRLGSISLNVNTLGFHQQTLKVRTTLYSITLTPLSGFRWNFLSRSLSM